MDSQNSHASHSQWTVYKVFWSKELHELYNDHIRSNYQLLSKLHLGEKILEAVKVSGHEYQFGITDCFSLVKVNAIDSIRQVQDGRKLVIRGYEPRLADNWFVPEHQLKLNAIFKGDLSEIMKEKLKRNDLLMVFFGRHSYNFVEKVQQIETNVSSSSHVHIIIYRHFSNGGGGENIIDYIRFVQNFPHLQCESFTNKERDMIKIYPKDVNPGKELVRLKDNFIVSDSNNVELLPSAKPITITNSRCEDDFGFESGNDEFKWKKISLHEDDYFEIPSPESDVSTGGSEPESEELSQLPHIKSLKQTIQEDARKLLEILESDEELEENVINSATFSDAESKKSSSRGNRIPMTSNNDNVSSMVQNRDSEVENVVASLVDKVQLELEGYNNENNGVPPDSHEQLEENDNSSTVSNSKNCSNGRGHTNTNHIIPTTNNSSSIPYTRDRDSDVVENVVTSLMDKVQLELEGYNNESNGVPPDSHEQLEENENSSTISKSKNCSNGRGQSHNSTNTNHIIPTTNNSSSMPYTRDRDSDVVENVVTSLVEKVHLELEASSSNNDDSSAFFDSSVNGNISLPSFKSRAEVFTPDFINYTVVRSSDKPKSRKYKNYKDYEAHCEKYNRKAS